MKSFLNLAALAAFLYLGVRHYNGDLFLRNPASLSADTCAGKKTCAVVYMAPWCPSCKRELGRVQGMLAKAHASNAGIRVIVGMGRAPGQNEEMASKLAKDVVLDTQGAIAQKLQIRAVPFFAVLDADQAVVTEGPEAYQWMMDTFK